MKLTFKKFLIEEDEMSEVELRRRLQAAKKELNHNGQTLSDFGEKNRIIFSIVPWDPVHQSKDFRWWNKQPVHVGSIGDFRIYDVGTIGVSLADKEMIAFVEKTLKRNWELSSRVQLLRRELFNRFS